MPRYSESRKKFPVHIELRLTKEQNSRALALASHWNVKRAEAIRRCIDDSYLSILSQNTTEQTIQLGETTP